MGMIIDADTHVAESEHMWALFEKELYPKRPILMSVPDDMSISIDDGCEGPARPD